MADARIACDRNGVTVETEGADHVAQRPAAEAAGEIDGDRIAPQLLDDARDVYATATGFVASRGGADLPHGRHRLRFARMIEGRIQREGGDPRHRDRKSPRLNSSH